jgi:hypothetical protein
MKITKPEIVEKVFALSREKIDNQRRIEQINYEIRDALTNEMNLINVEREKQNLLPLRYNGYTLNIDLSEGIKSIIIDDYYGY